MKTLIAALCLFTTPALADCIMENDVARDPAGKLGMATSSVCDISGYQYVELTYADGSTKSFESIPGETDAPMPVSLRGEILSPD